MQSFPLIDAQLQPLTRGGILYDAARIRKPTSDLFVRDYWATHGRAQDVSGGRGSVSFIRPDTESMLPDDAWVLRHYRRGGLVGPVLRDRYLWTGAERTRCVREWRLLAALHERGLPVPAPVAARFIRAGLTYTADLITAQLPPSVTLAKAICTGPLLPQQWQAIGRTVARFHVQGVHHADLNAHNILLGTDGAVYVLDFDRGQIRARGVWEAVVLARLQRSLIKITRQNAGAHFNDAAWRELRAGYDAAERNVDKSG